MHLQAGPGARRSALKFFHRRGRTPGEGQWSAGVGVTPVSAAEAALPAESLLFEGGCFRLRPDMGRRTGAVGFSEAVATGNERNCLPVINVHAGDGLRE